MFVRLFVDENLDRMVPISKQPKEKIQAIIESCSRQFPEFQERARKRIRTYLKSCRRMKKNGMEVHTLPLWVATSVFLLWLDDLYRSLVANTVHGRYWETQFCLVMKQCWAKILN